MKNTDKVKIDISNLMSHVNKVDFASHGLYSQILAIFAFETRLKSLFANDTRV